MKIIENIVELPITRNGFAKLLADYGFKEGVEIGTDEGIFAEQLCLANPELKLHCIDPWKTYEGYKDIQDELVFEQNYMTTVKRLKPYNCEIIRKFSADALYDFKEGSMDFVYIDGNHEFDYVLEDLENWSKIVKKGGIISGHDYKYKKNKYGYQTVTNALNTYSINYNLYTLYLTTRMHQSSWFFINE
jgi:predicted O-methyltransferase YrrM